MSINKRKPTHPGVVLKHDVIECTDMTVTEAAKKLGVTRKALSEFINEKSGCSPDMAIRISQSTGTSPDVWLNMQTKLDLWKSAQKHIKSEPFRMTIKLAKKC
jgi:addiction module HigA family antidote